MYNSKNFETAYLDCTKALGLAPTSSELYCIRGNLENEFGFFEDAISDFKKAIIFSPENADAYYGIAYSKYNTENFKETLLNLEIALKYKDDEKYYLLKGRAEYHLENYDEAILSFQNAISKNPMLDEAYSVLGYIFEITKNYKKAKKYFKKAMALSPDNTDCILGYISLKIDIQDKNILNEINYAISKNPSKSEFYSTRAFIYIKLNKFKSAYSDIEHALELNQNSGLAHFARGLLFQKNDRHKNAIKSFTKAIDIIPETLDYYLHRAKSYLWLCDYDNAVKDCNSYISLKKNNASQGYFLRSKIKFKIKDVKGAVSDFKKSIKCEKSFSKKFEYTAIFIIELINCPYCFNLI